MATKISMDELDVSLAAEVAGKEGCVAYEFPYDHATVGNQALHVVHSADDERGGIVLVGSGSSGTTYWTDAKTPQEVVARFYADEMVN